MIRLPDIPGLQGTKINDSSANATLGRVQLATGGPEMQAQTIRPQGVNAASVRPTQQADAAQSRGVPNASFVERRDVEMSNRGIMAQAAGAGRLADAIVGVSQQFAGVAIEAQRQENARTESEARLGMISAKAQFDLDLEKEIDPAARIEKTKKFYEDQKGVFDNMELSDNSRANLAEFYMVESTRGGIKAAGDAASLTQKRLSAQVENEMNAALESGDKGLHNRALASAVSSGILLPEQAAGQAQAFDRKLQDRAVQSQIMADPLSWKESHPPDIVPDGMNPAKYAELQSFANGQLRQRTADATGAILDSIASGDIDSEEKILASTTDLRPAVQEEIVNDWHRRQNSETKALIETPEFQQETYGKISAAIASYNPEAEDSDVRVAQIDILMRNLKPGFQKEQLEKRFKTLDTPTEAKTYGEFVLQQVDELHKAGRFGQPAEPGKITTQDIVKDGFLKDPEKLQRLGYSSVQAVTIAEAAAEDPALGQRAFIEQWGERPGGSVNASAVEIAAANALRLGHPTLNWNAAGEEQAAAGANLTTARTYGIAKMKMADYLRLNPDAKKEEIDKQFLKITGEGLKEDAKRKLLPVRPSRGPSSAPFKEGETSMVLPSALDTHRTAFITAGQQYGIDPRVLAAISMHETANGKSSAFTSKNNAMGVSNSSGPIAFDHVDDSIAKMARLLGSKTSGPYKSATTLEEIAKIYAPVGAENDPRGLNGSWLAGVSKYLEQLGLTASVTIK